MADVVDIESRRKGDWVVAHAVCLECRHTWVAIAEVSHTHMCRLECPKCGEMAGIGVVVPAVNSDAG